MSVKGVDGTRYHTWIASLSLVFLHKDCYLRLCKRGTIRIIHYETSHVSMNMANIRADSKFASSQWETALLCNDVSHWLGISLESAMEYDSFINLIYVHIQVPGFIIYLFMNLKISIQSYLINGFWQCYCRAALYNRAPAHLTDDAKSSSIVFMTCCS